MAHKKDLLLIVLLTIAIFTLNNLIFGIQLNYGFRDVDWSMLYYYKSFGNLSFNHLLSTYKLMGAYTYELYYVGFLEKIFGLNFIHLHLASQLFKVITGLGVYFLIYVVFKRKLLAILTSLLYTISYTHAGALFMLATGGYFFASIFMILFLIIYYYSLFNKRILIWATASLLLVLTLILNTERMYPLIPGIILVEFLIIISKKFKKDVVIISFKRSVIILFPLIIFAIIYLINSKIDVTNAGFSPSQFFTEANLRATSILNGNWQLLLYPFASFGSMFLFGDYWKFLGIIDVSSLTAYIMSLILGPILKLGIISFILSHLIYKKPIRITLSILALLFLFGLVIYSLFVNWLHLSPQVSVHFDPNLMVIPTLFGFFILSLSFFAFLEWKKAKNPNLLPLIIGPVFTMIFILLTWIASDLQLIFLGPQRYLSIPSMGTSLFMSGLLLIVFNGLRKIKFTRLLAWGIFLFLIPLVVINYSVAHDFFNYELNYAGMRADDQTQMKDGFRKLTQNINKKERSLFYFDETADHDNGYFDESTILAGFEFWTKVKPDGSIQYFPDPGMIRTNVQCPLHTHQNCLEILKKGFAINKGVAGIWYTDPIRGQTKPRFYKLTNFYALRFINKDLVDIRKEVLDEITK